MGHGSDGHMPHGHTYGQVGHGSDGPMSHGHHVSSPPLVRIDTGSVSSGETLNVHKRGIDEEQVKSTHLYCKFLEEKKIVPKINYFLLLL